MARGKHKASKTLRDAKAVSAQLDATRAELAGEEEQLAAAQVELAEIGELRAELARLTTERDAAVEQEEERLAAEVKLLASLVSDAEQRTRVSRERWEVLVGQVIDRFGRGSESIDLLMNALGRPGTVVKGPGQERLGAAASQLIQRARGERRVTTLDASPAKEHPGRGIASAVRAPFRAALERADEVDGGDEESLREADAVADAVFAVQVTACDLDAVHAWHPLPWLQADVTETTAGLPVAVTLGCAPSDERTSASPWPADQWPVPTAALPAPSRLTASGAGAAAVLDAWGEQLKANAAVVAGARRIPKPWSDPPRYPRPGDAVAVRHWYALAALGAWSKALDRADPASPGDATWVQAAGEVAVALVTAAPFWLPPGQTFGFVDSEPLTDDDADELRLPYPQVLMVLADPLVLPAVRQPDAELARALGYRDATAGELARGSEPAELLRFGGFVSRALPDPELFNSPLHLFDALAVRGGQVEAVLLLGDSLGRLADSVAWCVAVPAASGGVLGRYVVPARRSASGYSDQLLNLAAVASWGAWHPPDEELAVRPGLSSREASRLVGTSEFRRLEARGGAGGVRVLDVKRTGGSTRTAETIGRTVSPHVRRGHWRRQHHGPGGELVKRVRIAPVLVNAHRGGFAPRVYRLPAPESVP